MKWKLVPVEPTDEMVQEGVYTDDFQGLFNDAEAGKAVRRIFAAMLKVSPEVVIDDNGVTPADIVLADQIADVEFDNSHAAYEYAVAVVIARHRLAHDGDMNDRERARAIIAKSWADRGFPDSAAEIANSDVWVIDAMLAFAAGDDPKTL